MPKTKKRTKKKAKNKTAKKTSEWRLPNRFKFKHQNEADAPKSKDGKHFIRIQKHIKTKGLARIYKRETWPDELIEIFEALDVKWPRGGPEDPRLKVKIANKAEN